MSLESRECDYCQEMLYVEETPTKVLVECSYCGWRLEE